MVASSDRLRTILVLRPILVQSGTILVHKLVKLVKLVKLLQRPALRQWEIKCIFNFAPVGNQVYFQFCASAKSSVFSISFYNPHENLYLNRLIHSGIIDQMQQYCYIYNEYKMNLPWTPESAAYAANMFREGHDIDTIAVALDRTPRSIVAKFTQLGIYKAAPKPTREPTKAELVGLICNKLGLDPVKSYTLTSASVEALRELLRSAP
jgi:hypothetical protein